MAITNKRMDNAEKISLPLVTFFFGRTGSETMGGKVRKSMISS